MEQYRIRVFVDEAYASRIDEDLLVRYAVAALEAEQAPGPSELSIAVVGDAEIQELNRQYRDMDAPTDVLSFPWEEPSPAGDFVSPPDGVRRLGEIVIAYPYCARQAEAAEEPLEHELAHMVVHGVLHILGYDHAEPEEEGAMRAREEAILGRAVRWE